MDNRFTKSERLCGKKEINSLFENGSKLFSYPYRISYLLVDPDSQEKPVKLLISVSKRGFKKAVDRNQIKRYIREAYRTNKSILWDELQDKKMQIAILFIEKESKDLKFHSKAITKLLGKLALEVKARN